MDLSQVILGPIVTEKAERQKAAGPRHAYTMRIDPNATKVEVKKALLRYYDIEVEKVRVMRVRPKTRALGDGGVMEKRHSFKKAIVTLAPKSKPLDLASFIAES
jgi:large subunit ribosomal protein L23